MKHKDILLLLIPSFVLIVAWIVFSIYHSSVTSTITETVTKEILPISPIFDQDAIDAVKQKGKVAPVYEAKTKIIIEETPTPTIATESASESTESGESKL